MSKCAGGVDHCGLEPCVNCGPPIRHQRIVAFNTLETCQHCACLLDGTHYHDCKNGKVKHLCLDLTHPKKEKN